MGLATILFLASTLAQPQSVDLSWLAGHWIQAEGDRVTEEIWTDDAGGLMLGVNRTVRGGQARAFEFLRIQRSAEGVYYCAQPNGSPATCFEMTDAGDASIVFENAENDFPQRISYRREADELIATISDLEGAQTMQWSWKLRRTDSEGR